MGKNRALLFDALIGYCVFFNSAQSCWRRPTVNGSTKREFWLQVLQGDDAGDEFWKSALEQGSSTRGMLWSMFWLLAGKLDLFSISSDCIVYREKEGGVLEILCGFRCGEPWNGFLNPSLGGYVSKVDKGVVFTAQRETSEESGGLAVHVTNFVHTYGPERWHAQARPGMNPDYNAGRFEVVTTGEPAHTKPVVALVFAGKVVGCDNPADNSEQSGLRWLTPEQIVCECGERITFDHAHALQRFLEERKRGAGMETLRFFKGMFS